MSYIVDRNNTITRISDSKIIPRDITNNDYKNFLYCQQYKIDPITSQKVFNFVSKYPSSDK